MNFPLFRFFVWFLALPINPLLLSPASAQPKGTVDCTLEWHNGHQVYTYIFAGKVSRQGVPSANARIQLHLNGPDRKEVIEETVAKADGSYELKVALTGIPEDAADWKLVAQNLDVSDDMTEIEGRTILMNDESTVTVQRLIQLGVQG
jgi:hypothetical protein